jgi:hypothetical protein
LQQVHGIFLALLVVLYLPLMPMLLFEYRYSGAIKLLHTCVKPLS